MQAHKPILFALMIAALAAGITGCLPEREELAQSLAHPGPTAYQRALANQHDPFLLNDVGPEVVGGRPRDFDMPMNEVERARLGRTPPPGVAPIVAPAVTVTPVPAPGAVPAYAPQPGTAPAPYAAAPAPITTSPAALPVAPTAPIYPTAPAPVQPAVPIQPRAPY
jgi:hypothetical protein